MGSKEGSLVSRTFCRILSEKLLSSKTRVWLGIPMRFFEANRKLLERWVVLENSAGETWEVVIDARHQNAHAGFRNGWEDFAYDNGLSDGDVVVFKLVKQSHFQVTIFGRYGEEKQPGLNTYGALRKLRKKTEIQRPEVVYLTDEDEDEPSEGHAAAVADSEVEDSMDYNGGESKSKDGCCSNSKDVIESKRKPVNLSPTPSSTKGLSAAHKFQKRLKHPSCVKIIPCTIFQLCFDKQFARLLPDETTTINLTTDKTLRRWPVRWLVNKMGSGWNAFAKDNRLKRGDVCVFEVLEAKAVNVHIFKQQQEQQQHIKSPRRQTRSIMQALQKNKPNKDVTNKTEETVSDNMVFETSLTSLQAKEECNRILASKDNLEETNLKICFHKDETGELTTELTARVALERSKADFLVAIAFPNARALLEHLVKEASADSTAS